MIHAITKQNIPIICKKTDCVKTKCLIKYTFESKFCESYENSEQRVTRLQQQLLQDEMTSDGKWFEQYERLIMMERQNDVLRIIKKVKDGDGFENS